MIRHIIFDMGGVLRIWDPHEFMKIMEIPGDDQEILMREIFGAVEWPMQDIGLITEQETLERVRGRIPGSEYFDGLVISAFEGVLKPDLTMYRTILSRFALKAEECVFTDDMPANVAGALAAGIDGFVFRGTEDFIRELRVRGVRI